MEEIGIVKKTEGENATVILSRKSSCCEHCMEESCEIPENGIETVALNAAGAKTGQKVKVVMRTYTYYKGALLIYVLPVVALMAGAVLGKVYLPSYFAGTDSDLLAVCGGFLAFLASLGVVKLILNRSDKKTESRSVIESIVEV